MVINVGFSVLKKDMKKKLMKTQDKKEINDIKAKRM